MLKKIIEIFFFNTCLLNYYSLPLIHQTNKNKKIMETQIENYTNNKLNNWYKNAKLYHNVTGFGTAKIEGNEIKIDFTENGVSKTWSMSFYPEYAIDNGLDYFFNVWSEKAI